MRLCFDPIICPINKRRRGKIEQVKICRIITKMMNYPSNESE